MGKIQRMKSKVVVRLGADEILTARIAVEKDHTFTLAELIRWYAEMKAKEKKVELPGGVIVTSFDPASSEFVVTFSCNVEDAI
jgi:hypothetical protein